MQQLIWFALAWVGGTAAILGSLMTIASLLLWLIPVQSARTQKPNQNELSATGLHRLKLTAASGAIALVGFGILIVSPFPG